MTKFTVTAISKDSRAIFVFSYEGGIEAEIAADRQFMRVSSLHANMNMYMARGYKMLKVRLIGECPKNVDGYNIVRNMNAVSVYDA